ncbi:hypothetical protein D018_1268B, partial [Vibrio parahaemolyticus VP2007-007]
VRDENRC